MSTQTECITGPEVHGSLELTSHGEMTILTASDPEGEILSVIVPTVAIQAYVDDETR